LRLALTNWLTRPLKLGFGGYTVWLKGATRVDWRDSYYLVVALSWPWFLLTIVAAVVVINVGFALLYLAEPGSVAHARPGSFADAFFFSFETASTLGYGNMYPATVYGHCVSTVEIFVGMGTTALTTGLLFVRFARPKARLRYARNPVIAVHEGKPTLMIRIANGRRSLLFDAAAYLSLVLTHRGPNGRAVRRIYELRLIRSRLPMFSLTWTLMHRIDETSPLHGFDATALQQHDALLIVGVGGHDEMVAARVLGTRTFTTDDILFGMRYTENISIGADGRITADLTTVSATERDIGPEPEYTGWEDRTWHDAD
jgi:inward rectifier potassium channel